MHRLSWIASWPCSSSPRSSICRRHLFLPPQPSRSSCYGYSSWSRVTSLQSSNAFIAQQRPSSDPVCPLLLDCERRYVSVTHFVRLKHCIQVRAGCKYSLFGCNHPTSTRCHCFRCFFPTPLSPDYNVQLSISPYTTEDTRSQRSPPPLSPSCSNTPSPDSDISPVHIMGA